MARLVGRIGGSSGFAERLFGAHLRQLERHIRKNGTKRLEQLYKEARSDLYDQLLRAGGKMSDTPTAIQLRAMIAQADGVLSRLGKGIHKQLRDVSKLSAELGAEHGRDEFRELEKHFRGTTPVLSLEKAAILRDLVKDVDASILRRHQLVSTTWTAGAIADMERVLSTGALAGKPLEGMVDDVMGVAGLMNEERWRAERIVRTELSHAHNSAKFKAMQKSQEDQGRPLYKKLITTFDDRTGDDSFLQHGQTVPVDQPFEWKHKRRGGTWVVTRYQHPPNRPNDREVIIPWDPEWEPTKEEKALTNAELKSARTTRWRSKPGVTIPPGHVPGQPYTYDVPEKPEEDLEEEKERQREAEEESRAEAARLQREEAERLKAERIEEEERLRKEAVREAELQKKKATNIARDQRSAAMKSIVSEHRRMKLGDGEYDLKIDPDDLEVLEELLDRKISPEDIVNISGAPKGSRVRVRPAQRSPGSSTLLNIEVSYERPPIKTEYEGEQYSSEYIGDGMFEIVQEFKDGSHASLGVIQRDKDTTELPDKLELDVEISEGAKKKILGDLKKKLREDPVDMILGDRSIKASWKTDEVYLSNDSLDISPQKTGMGTGYFASQVEACRKVGIGKINAYCARVEGALNGYNTWARFGYDGKVPKELQDKFDGAETIQEIMETQEGRDAWLELGDSFYGTFETAQDSNSSKVLGDYLLEKEARKKGGGK
jgi:hypothetical protein